MKQLGLDKINQLAIMAGGSWKGGFVETPSGDHEYTPKKFIRTVDMDAQQFAELIVQECLDAVGNKTCPNAAYIAIQKHFGIE